MHCPTRFSLTMQRCFVLTGKSPGGSDQGRCYRAKRAVSLYSKRLFTQPVGLRESSNTPSVFHPLLWMVRSELVFSVGASALISSFHVLKYQQFTRPSWSNCARPKVLLALGLKWISKGEWKRVSILVKFFPEVPLPLFYLFLLLRLPESQFVAEPQCTSVDLAHFDTMKICALKITHSFSAVPGASVQS